MEHLIRNNKLAVHQSGNRKLHFTETALLYVTDQLLQAMDDKKVSIMVLLDMSKAFDTIRHDILLSKLQSLYFSQDALDWFQSYLSHRQQCVMQSLKYTHSSSEFRRSNCSSPKLVTVPRREERLPMSTRGFAVLCFYRGICFIENLFLFLGISCLQVG